MRILFTGASSFTGMWFIKDLVQRGHRVTAIFQQPQDMYTGIRRKRIDSILRDCHAHFTCSFGDETFLKLLEQPWDIVCHHAAIVKDYRSMQFDVAAALSKNTYNIINVLESMRVNESRHFLLSGSIFEPNEGLSSESLGAMSPYGLSKGLTSDVFKYYCNLKGISFSKFVIPNPFGPLEEERFTTYLAKQWLLGHTAEVKNPDYIRDNIPVTLLARSYSIFVENIAAKQMASKFNPSFRPESQKAFTMRFAKEMENRWQIPCPVTFHCQTVFSEPLSRINSDSIIDEKWNEVTFWNALAEYYKCL